MQKIPLKLAKPGMVLAKPVAKDNGMVLLAQGTELNESALERMERMNIERIVIEGELPDLDGAGAGTNYGQILDKLDHLFRKHEKDAWMMKLKKGFRHYLQLKAAAASSSAAAVDEEESGE